MRDSRGRFRPGNKAAVGRGNPHAARVNAWRSALAATVTEDDLQTVIAKLVDRAKNGEPWAIRELLDRCLGKATQSVEPAVQYEVGDVELKVTFDEPLRDASGISRPA